MTEGCAGFVRRGGWWVAGQGLLTLAVGVLGIACPGRPTHLCLAVGAILLALAALTGLLGLLALGRRLTPFPRPADDAELIESGIYGLIRHPLYTCNLCAFFGWACLWGSRWALLPALASVGFFLAKARREERWLCQRFPRYPAYQQRVKRFIPWIF